ncbi:MBL fold metallo-hydrolase [Telmatobacter bradus]|uniref:MBL fold metallo-hydrolase n=1 Tax=Telmatobacter bradus TaxID=474953 RepID=UPI003B4312A8
MVRFTVLASGSKGNSTVVTGGRTRILIDAGLSCRELFRRMRAVGEDPETLQGILITHEHADHVNGIVVTARKLGIPVYFTEATHRAWMRWLTPRRQMSYTQWLEKMRQEKAAAPEEGEIAPEEQVEETSVAVATAEDPTPLPTGKQDPVWLPKVEYFAPGEPFSIGDLIVNPFTTPHDAADPCGFVLESEGIRMGYATDLGYMPPNVKQQLKSLNLLLLESNHDPEMLRDGPYPWAVKQRVLSRVGHLSNNSVAEFLKGDYDRSAEVVILAHLSESNNLPELAHLSASQALNTHGQLFANQLLVASQQEPLQSILF